MGRGARKKKIGLEREEGFEDSVPPHYYNIRRIQGLWASIGKAIRGGSRLELRLLKESNSRYRSCCKAFKTSQE
jgi:hypothetical protein